MKQGQIRDLPDERFGLRFNLIAGIYNLEVGKNDRNVNEGKKHGLGS